MTGFTRKLSVYFTAGAAGGLVNGLCAWLLGDLGVTATFGVTLAPHLTPAMLYHRVVWGGLWGAIFLLPIAVRSPVARGLLYSLGPTFVQLFIVFPEKAGKGMMGLELGAMTPAFVVLYNAVWGLTAVLWLKLVGEK